MDADGLTFACALPGERRVAKRLGATALVGMSCTRGIPEGRLVSFGLAGALRNDLPIGTVIDATRIVDERGTVVWNGGPVGARGAREGTVLTTDRIVDDPEERERLHRQSGADIVDMESGLLAATGRLVGCIRAVSDTPSRPLGALGALLKPDGRVDLLRVLTSPFRSPRPSRRAIGDVQTALRALRSVA